MNIKRIALLATTAGALALGACSGGSEEASAVESNAANMAPIEVANESPVATEAPAATRIDNLTTDAEPAPETLSADEQTQDDADATGMTARVSRDEGNDAAPAE